MSQDEQAAPPEYNSTLEQARTEGSSTAEKYIKKLCHILKAAGWAKDQIRDRVKTDCLPTWSRLTINKFMDASLKDPRKVRAGKAGGEAKSARARSVLAENHSDSEKEAESERLVQVTADGMSAMEQTEDDTPRGKRIDPYEEIAELPSRELNAMRTKIEEQKAHIERMQNERVKDKGGRLQVENDMFVSLYKVLHRAMSANLPFFYIEHDGERVTATSKPES